MKSIFYDIYVFSKKIVEIVSLILLYILILLQIIIYFIENTF